MPTRKMFLLALAGLALASASHAATSINGRWMTQNKDAIVEIDACGPSICGKIVKYLVTPPQGIDQKDVNNPKPALRGRKVLGINILSGFRADGNVWRGTIYDPKSGKSYRSVIHKNAVGKLVVKGCVGPFCQSQIWTATR